MKSTGNASTERHMAQLLRYLGLSGWRRRSKLLGRPDFVWPDKRVALFVDGCFWHGCPRCYRRPRTHSSFWRAKLVYNRYRDKLVARELRKRGWKVIRVWECRIEDLGTATRLRTVLSTAATPHIPPKKGRNQIACPRTGGAS